jgi:hypothetical protein
MIIKVNEDGSAESYSIARLKKDNPNVSFPQSIPDETMAEYKVYSATRAAPQEYDPLTHVLSWAPFTQDDSGAWVQNSVITALPEAEAAQNQLDALNSAKESKCAEVNAARNTSINKPYRWPEPIDGKTRDFNVNLLDELNAAMVLGDSETQPWICEDNEYPGVTLTKAQMLQICRHIRARKTTLVHEGRRIKNEILALTTVDAVNNYVIEI